MTAPKPPPLKMWAVLDRNGKRLSFLRANSGDENEQISLFKHRSAAENDAFDLANMSVNKMATLADLSIVRVRVEVIDGK